MRGALLQLRLDTPRSPEQHVAQIRVWGGQPQRSADAYRPTTRRPPPAGDLPDQVAQVAKVPGYEVPGGRQRAQMSTFLPSMGFANHLTKSAPNTQRYIGGGVCTDITSWANLQLCFASPRLDYATACVPRRAYPVNLATVPVEYESGSKDKTLVSPSKPGIGTGLDMSKLGKYIRHDSAKPTTQSSD